MQKIKCFIFSSWSRWIKHSSVLLQAHPWCITTTTHHPQHQNLRHWRRKCRYAIAQTILTQDLADEIALVDVNPDKLRGEMLDLQHAAAFLPRTTISASVDHSCTVGSDLVIVTAGCPPVTRGV
ncbi:putative L-lactate dehydrogenase [Helianthus annuus]|nr:putative L-lactate dehydrogenase [Helianthus annuus]